MNDQRGITLPGYQRVPNTVPMGVSHDERDRQVATDEPVVVLCPNNYPLVDADGKTVGQASHPFAAAVDDIVPFRLIQPRARIQAKIDELAACFREAVHSIIGRPNTALTREQIVETIRAVLPAEAQPTAKITALTEIAPDRIDVTVELPYTVWRSVHEGDQATVTLDATGPKQPPVIPHAPAVGNVNDPSGWPEWLDVGKFYPPPADRIAYAYKAKTPANAEPDGKWLRGADGIVRQGGYELEPVDTTGAVVTDRRDMDATRKALESELARIAQLPLTALPSPDNACRVIAQTLQAVFSDLVSDVVPSVTVRPTGPESVHAQVTLALAALAADQPVITPDGVVVQREHAVTPEGLPCEHMPLLFSEPQVIGRGVSIHEGEQLVLPKNGKPVQHIDASGLNEDEIATIVQSWTSGRDNPWSKETYIGTPKEQPSVAERLWEQVAAVNYIADRLLSLPADAKDSELRKLCAVNPALAGQVQATLTKFARRAQTRIKPDAVQSNANGNIYPEPPAVIAPLPRWTRAHSSPALPLSASSLQPPPSFVERLRRALPSPLPSPYWTPGLLLLLADEAATCCPLDKAARQTLAQKIFAALPRVVDLPVWHVTTETLTDVARTAWRLCLARVGPVSLRLLTEVPVKTP